MTARLDALIVDLRREIGAELPSVLHIGTPLASEPGDTTYGHITGLPFSVRFERRIGHPDWYGINELAASSILEAGDWCRSRHQSDLHRCPGRSTSLCERIVMGLGQYGQPLAQVAWRERLPLDITATLAERALLHAARWRHRELHRYMRNARERQRDTVVYCPLCQGARVQMRRRAA